MYSTNFICMNAILLILSYIEMALVACNILIHTLSSLSFPKEKTGPKRKDCTPRMCATLTFRVYQACLTITDILPAKKSLHTLRAYNLFFEGFYSKHNSEVFFTVKESLAHSQSVVIYQFHFNFQSGMSNAFASKNLISSISVTSQDIE